MDGNPLWELIDEARSRERRLDGQVRFLEDALADLSGPKVIELYREFMAAHRRAFNDELWAAFDLAMGYTGDDSFTDARTWLILQGHATFERVLVDPDELADTNFDDVEDLGLAEQLAANLVGHAERFVKQGSASALEVPEDLTDLPGYTLSRDLEVLRHRFPKIAARYAPPGAIN